MPGPTQLRNGVEGLAVLADEALAVLWANVSTADEAKAALVEILPILVEGYGSAAATLAADWYDELREELEVSGRFTASPVELDDLGTDELAGWGVSPLYQAAPDWAAARVLVAGGLQRRIANAARETVSESSIADPQARGWQRVGHGECDFCAMLIGRGIVYTRKNVRFASHDHCKCTVVPAFGGGRPLPVKPYTPSARKSSPADRARTRAWMKANL